ncbi:hypothetical protein T10_5895 [Trichinella papuae]|uniref:Uncharacterized protein n=1 Tax=Trichinella papuae TaxID=268474 RepID=A0A0V1MAU4_9BILA|nr:hypothetical protein T10_5895 [Trichinella papuae]
MEKSNRAPPWSVKLPFIRQWRGRAPPLLFGQAEPRLLDSGEGKAYAIRAKEVGETLLFCPHWMRMNLVLSRCFHEGKFRTKSQCSWEGRLAAPILAPQGWGTFRDFVNFIQGRFSVAVATRTA